MGHSSPTAGGPVCAITSRCDSGMSTMAPSATNHSLPGKAGVSVTLSSPVTSAACLRLLHLPSIISSCQASDANVLSPLPPRAHFDSAIILDPQSATPRSTRGGSPRTSSPRPNRPPSPPPLPGTLPLETFRERARRLRKAEGQMYLDVRAAAQSCKSNCIAPRSCCRSLQLRQRMRCCTTQPTTCCRATGRSRANGTSRTICCDQRPTSMLETHREELHHALKHLKERAARGHRAMVERADALDACVAALRETIEQLCALTPDATTSRRPDSVYGGHGLLSPGTLAPTNLASALSLSPSGNSPASAEAASWAPAHHALSIVEAPTPAGKLTARECRRPIYAGRTQPRYAHERSGCCCASRATVVP